MFIFGTAGSVARLQKQSKGRTGQFRKQSDFLSLINHYTPIRIVMKEIIYPILLTLLPGIMLAQDDRFYTTTSGELIFSFASVETAGSKDGSIMRFSPVFNIQNWVNFDKSEKLGFFSGLSLRNVGFIYDVNDTTRKKYRTYNIGIPVGIKFGNLSDKFLFFGYELEIPKIDRGVYNAASTRIDTRCVPFKVSAEIPRISFFRIFK